MPFRLLAVSCSFPFLYHLSPSPSPAIFNPLTPDSLCPSSLIITSGLTSLQVITFWVPENPSTGEPEKRIDAAVGDYVVVPTRAPHTFSNETDEEAKFVNTFTPVCLVVCSIKLSLFLDFLYPSLV